MSEIVGPRTLEAGRSIITMGGLYFFGSSNSGDIACGCIPSLVQEPPTRNSVPIPSTLRSVAWVPWPSTIVIALLERGT
jgi:hypothetical protein